MAAVVCLVRVDPWLLAACIAAAAAGAVAGAPIVLRLPIRAVQAVVGVALLLAALAFAATNLDLMPGGGTALSLPPPRFALAVAGYFLFGALMTCGIGLFAPSLVLLPLLGMNPAASFPDHDGGLRLPDAGGRPSFPALGADRYAAGDRNHPGGIPAVLLAALVVKSMPLAALRWSVVIVVVYAAALLLRSAATGGRAPAGADGLQG